MPQVIFHLFCALQAPESIEVQTTIGVVHAHSQHGYPRHAAAAQTHSRRIHFCRVPEKYPPCFFCHSCILRRKMPVTQGFQPILRLQTGLARDQFSAPLLGNTATKKACPLSLIHAYHKHVWTETGRLLYVRRITSAMRCEIQNTWKHQTIPQFDLQINLLLNFTSN